MPKMSDVEISESPQSVIIYGPPKSGKTYLAGLLAKEFDLYWADIENGGATLKQLPREYQARINYIRIIDTKDTPNGINTCLQLITGAKVNMCVAHGIKDCPICKRDNAEFELWELSKIGPKGIAVFDSLSQLTSSANAWATRKLDRDKGQNEEFGHWRYQGTLLEKFLDYVQNSGFHVVVIAHEMGIDQEEGGEKIMPAGGTKNFARSVSKYFGHIIYTTVQNKKHISMSTTTSSHKILTGSRLGVDVSTNPEEAILSIFSGKLSPTNTPKPAATTTVAPAAQAGRAGLLSTLRK